MIKMSGVKTFDIKRVFIAPRLPLDINVTGKGKKCKDWLSEMLYSNTYGNIL